MEDSSLFVVKKIATRLRSRKSQGLGREPCIILPSQKVGELLALARKMQRASKLGLRSETYSYLMITFSA
ncbi:unnamed protein product [Dovyalis caffra]|uniref:Uncharacterized protein n=1 Tax=Dovyalis caffra TaxID=77055 RepID=A0AAV1R5P9_9ROSI|nr:unnamed protein product [Dovyalis caffra]